MAKPHGRDGADSLRRTHVPAVPPHGLPSRPGRGAHLRQPGLLPLKTKCRRANPSAGAQHTVFPRLDLKIDTALLYRTAFCAAVRQAEGLSSPRSALAENG